MSRDGLKARLDQLEAAVQPAGNPLHRSIPDRPTKWPADPGTVALWVLKARDQQPTLANRTARRR
jgi:hypothetical protein